MKKILIALLFACLPLTASAAVTFPINGGTGTSIIPTFGQVLLGNTGGTYTPVATSSLGIQTAPAGSTGQFQYNNGGLFGGTSLLQLIGGGLFATTTSATSTNLFSTRASFTSATTTNLSGTNISGFGLSSCAGATNALTWSGNNFGCNIISASGSGTIATSSVETSGRIPFWTSTSATTALLSGGVAGFSWDNTLSKLTATNIGATLSTTTAATSTNLFSTRGVFTAATSTSFAVTGLASTFLAVDTNGSVIATSTPINTGGASQGVNWATAAVLSGTPTYANGSSGVGATLTEVGTGALSVDSNSPAIGDRVLVKNQASAFQNGIYTVTATGSGIASYILTRTTDYNAPIEITPGLTTYVVSGTANSDSTWAVSYTLPLTIGTTNLTYTELAGGGAAVASVSNSDGTLTISPTTGAVVASLNLAHGNIWTASTTFNFLNAGLSTTTSATTTNLFATKAVFTGATTTVLANLNSAYFPLGASTNYIAIGTTTPAKGFGSVGTTPSPLTVNNFLLPVTNTTSITMPGSIVGLVAGDTGSSATNVAGVTGYASTTENAHSSIAAGVAGINSGPVGTLSVGGSIGAGIYANQLDTFDATHASYSVYALGGVSYFQNAVGIATTTPAFKLSVGSGGINVAENVPATSTSMTVDWSAGNQQLVKIGTSATTIAFSNAIAGAHLTLVLCTPPSGTAGAVTFTGVLWPGGTAPVTTTTAKKCDIITLLSTFATTTGPQILGGYNQNY